MSSGGSTGQCRWMRRLRVRISTRRTRSAPSRTQGAGSNQKNLPGHGIGRSRGGLTTTHQAVDGHGRPVAMIVTGGQRNDGAMLAELLAQIHVPRHGRGGTRTRPDAVIADRAYATGVIRDRAAPAQDQGRDPRQARPGCRPDTTRQQGRQATRAGCCRLQGPQRHRAVLRPCQAVARHRDALGQARDPLPRRRHPLRDPHRGSDDWGTRPGALTTHIVSDSTIRKQDASKRAGRHRPCPLPCGWGSQHPMQIPLDNVVL